MATRSKQKSLVRKANADKRPRAVAKYVRISPYKVRVLLAKSTTKRSLSWKTPRKLQAKSLQNF